MEKKNTRLRYAGIRDDGYRAVSLFFVDIAAVTVIETILRSFSSET